MIKVYAGVEREYNLETRYDSRKSFYGKAVVIVKNDGTKQLRSYNTIVAEITPEGSAEVYGTYSPTTLRHIKEFLKQFGYSADTKAEIEELYM
jgi:hypothetical protein